MGIFVLYDIPVYTILMELPHYANCKPCLTKLLVFRCDHSLKLPSMGLRPHLIPSQSRHTERPLIKQFCRALTNAVVSHYRGQLSLVYWFPPTGLAPILSNACEMLKFWRNELQEGWVVLHGCQPRAEDFHLVRCQKLRTRET